MKILKPLRLESISNEVSWGLTDHFNVLLNGKEYLVHQGYVTDLFSIPGLLRSIVFRSRRYVEAAVLHDAAYTGDLYEMTENGFQKCDLTRKEADRIIRDAMKSMKAPWSLYQSVYAGVRAGGWMYFQKNK